MLRDHRVQKLGLRVFLEPAATQKTLRNVMINKGLHWGEGFFVRRSLWVKLILVCYDLRKFQVEP